MVQEVSKTPKPGLDTVTVSSPSEQGVKVVEQANTAKQESVSSESESEEEAEYHPNSSLSISHTQIPEEKEEDVEQEEKKEGEPAELDAPDASAVPAEVSLLEEKNQKEAEEEAVMKNTEEEKRGEREVDGSADHPVITPEEVPNGVTLPEESVTGTAAHSDEEKDPKVNGETSLTEAELRPQVICCSEVKSSMGDPRSFPGLRSFLPALETPTCFFPSCLPQCQFSFLSA